MPARIFGSSFVDTPIASSRSATSGSARRTRNHL